MLEVESSTFSKKPYSGSNAAQGAAAAAATSAPDASFNPDKYFDRWLADVQASAPLVGAQDSAEIYLEAARGSRGELTFDGILHFDGYTVGNIRSLEGTLVLAKEGRVDADIYVRKAIISGSVTGNIYASEGVVLDSEARVIGEIYTRILSVRVGALFEGDCIFAEGADSSETEVSAGVEWLETRRE